MSATRMIIPTGPALITLDDAGEIIDVRHQSGGDRLLSRFGAGGSVIEVRRDVDEVEVLSRHGSATVSLRQSFAAGWTTRVMITSGELDVAIRLPLLVPDGVVPWLMCTGSEGWLAVLSSSTGPLLTARVSAGSLTGLTPDGLVMAPSRGAGEQRPLTLLWDWAQSPAHMLPKLPAGLPARGTFRNGSVAVLQSDPDTAVTADAAIGTEESDHGHEVVLFGSSPDRGRVTFHSARGTTGTSVGWAPSDADLLTEAARHAMSGPRTAAGVVRIPDLSAALVLQHVIAASATGGDPAMLEALDLFTARSSPDSAAPVLRPWWCSYLVGEHQRLQDDELLDQAATCLHAAVRSARRSDAVPAGLGLAAARLTVALLLSGRSAPDPLAAVVDLVTQLPDPSSPGWWEARLITDRLIGSRRITDLEHLVGFGRRLGGGLPGRAVRPLPVAAQAQLIAVLRLVPEGLDGRLARDWGVGLAELIDRSAADLCARLDGQPPGPAHAWLAVAESPL